jgi:hypothetical protein
MLSLGWLDLKFRNAVRGRLLPGEMLRAVAFAPAVWERRFLVLQRRLVAATALVATDWRLLIVEEGEPVRENTYGSSAYSIPRNRIADLRRAAFFLSFFGAIATIGAWAMGPALRS